MWQHKSWHESLEQENFTMAPEIRLHPQPESVGRCVCSFSNLAWLLPWYVHGPRCWSLDSFPISSLTPRHYRVLPIGNDYLVHVTMWTTGSEEDFTILLGKEMEPLRGSMHDHNPRAGVILHNSILSTVNGERSEQLAKSSLLGTHCMCPLLCCCVVVAHSTQTIHHRKKESWPHRLMCIILQPEECYFNGATHQIECSWKRRQHAATTALQLGNEIQLSATLTHWFYEASSIGLKQPNDCRSPAVCSSLCQAVPDMVLKCLPRVTLSFARLLVRNYLLCA